MRDISNISEHGELQYEGIEITAMTCELEPLKC